MLNYFFSFVSVGGAGGGVGVGGDQGGETG